MNPCLKMTCLCCCYISKRLIRKRKNSALCFFFWREKKIDQKKRESRVQECSLWLGFRPKRKQGNQTRPSRISTHHCLPVLQRLPPSASILNIWCRQRCKEDQRALAMVSSIRWIIVNTRTHTIKQTNSNLDSLSLSLSLLPLLSG